MSSPLIFMRGKIIHMDYSRFPSRQKTIEKTCASCGDRFFVNSQHLGQKTCSRTCGMNLVKSRGGSTSVACIVCGSEFSAKRSEAPRRKTCSRECMRLHRREPLKDRIARLCEIDDSGCWIWKGARTADGYGKSSIDGRTHPAHVVSYRAFVGPIPAGLQLDHKCRVRNCVNPRHLEAVTSRENTLRSPICPSAMNARKTHCKRGHEFTFENTYVGKNSRGRAYRDCRICHNEKMKRRYALRRAA